MPQAVADSYNVVGGSLTVSAASGVMANDINPTGQPATAQLVNPPVFGSVSLNLDGSFAYAAQPGMATTDSFSYQITAGGMTSNVATVTLNVAPTAGPTFTWTQTPPAAPTITNPGNLTGVEGKAVSLAIQATGNGPLHYAALELPTGLAMDPVTGVISGTPSPTAGEDLGGQYMTTVIVSGAGGGSTTAQFGFAITPAPTLDNPGDQTNTAGDGVSVQLDATGPNGDPLAYNVTGLPTGLAVDPNGLIGGTIDPSAVRTFIVSARVTDTVTGASASQTFNWAVAAANTPAYLPPMMDPIDDATNSAGDVVDISIDATGTNPLTYSAVGLPPGLAMDPNTAEVSGTLPDSAFRTTPYQVTVTATDEINSVSQTFNWTVNAVGVPYPGDQTNTVGDTVSLSMAGHDATGGTLNYSVTGLPPGLAMDPSGNIGGTIQAAPSGQTSYDVTVTATDGTNTGSAEFTWTVQPAPAPAVTLQPFAAAEGRDTGSVAVATFTAAAGIAEYEFSTTINWGDGSSDQGIVYTDNGVFTVYGDHTYAGAGSYPASVTVTGPDGTPGTGVGTETVTPAAVTPVSGFQVGATVGRTGEVVTEFDYGNPSALASSFTAWVDPGDGSGMAAGTVSSLGNGLYSVSLPHGYAHAGPETATVRITDPHGVQTVTTATVEVGDIVVGEPASLTAGTFNVGNPMAQASSYTATIAWGDGTTGTGTVTGTGGVFTVTGNHTYGTDSIDTPGGNPVTVTLSTAGQTVATASQNVVVTRPTIAGQIANVAVEADGTVFTQPIAAFEVPDGTDAAGEFQATIAWGDGTTSVGVVSGGSGLFTVTGGHQYATAANHVIQVSVVQSWSGFSLGWVIAGVGLLPGAAPPPRKAATPQLAIEGRSKAIAFKQSKVFGAGIRWKFDAMAGPATADREKGGYIIQHITSKELGWNYWELWRVDASGTGPEGRPTTAAERKAIITKLNGLDRDLKARILANPALAVALNRARAPLRLLKDQMDYPTDDTFGASLGGANGNKVTITGEAYFIDAIVKDDLPKIGRTDVFTPGGDPASLFLLSAPYTGANVKAIDDFLAMNKKTTSAKVTQSLTGVLKGGVPIVTGSPKPGTLSKLKLP